MPVEGLSLLGFLDRQEACRYLEDTCALADRSQSALEAHWGAAKKRLAGPVSSAGHPECAPLPPQLDEYINRVRHSGVFSDISRQFPNHSFQLVEIDPLLAFQFHIETSRAQSLCESVSSSTEVTRLAEICLPTSAERYEPQVVPRDGSLTIQSDSLNLRILHAGVFPQDDGTYETVAGAYLTLGCPLVHAAKYRGRLFLRNGYHRVYGLRRAGVTHIPCLVVEARTLEETGVVGGGSTFEAHHLNAEIPPTCGHFTDARAYPVQLRKMSRVISVAWSEATFIERY